MISPKVFIIFSQNLLTLLIVCIFLLSKPYSVEAQQYSPSKSLPSSASSPPQITSLEDRIRHLEAKVQILEGKRKDVWDKVNAISGLVSGLISGGLLAAIGIYATYAYQRRAIAVSQVQAVQSFMPHLQSREPKEIQVALLAITALGNAKLATALADMYQPYISIPALSKIASRANRAEAKQGEKSLEAVFRRFDRLVFDRRQKLLKLSDEYDQIRRTVAASNERTKAMESILQKMRDVAQEMKKESLSTLPLLQEFTSRTSDGANLAAIAILQVQPNLDYLDWLAEKLATDPGAFHGYHAALAFCEAAEILGKEHRSVIQEAINLARAQAKEGTRGADAFKKLDEAENKLS